jgi:pimeloyl-ACP methyl ester carboxylesterase
LWLSYSHQHLHRIRSKLADIRVPVMWSAEGAIFPLSHASPIVRALPQAKMVTISRCGHWSLFDAPEEVAQFMIQFFSANGLA